MISTSAGMKPLRYSLNDRKSESFVRELFENAGVIIGGSAPQDITVHDPAFYTRVLRDGSLGIGEAYMDGQWDSNALDETMYRLLLAKLDVAARNNRKLVVHTNQSQTVQLPDRVSCV